MEDAEASNVEGYTHEEFCDVVEKAILTVTHSEAFSFRFSPQVYIDASTFIRESLMVKIILNCKILPDWQDEYTTAGQKIGFSQHQIVIMLVELITILSNWKARGGVDMYAQSVFHLRAPKSLIMVMEPPWTNTLNLIISEISIKFGITSLPDNIE